MSRTLPECPESLSNCRLSHKPWFSERKTCEQMSPFSQKLESKERLTRASLCGGGARAKGATAGEGGDGSA